MNQRVEMIDTHHEEIIHDISFDHYGTRFATCSSDQTIKIYGKNSSGRFVKQGEKKCHDGPVWRVKWAHPQFGTIIATCSQDKYVRLWEEKKKVDEDLNNPNGYNVNGSEWVQKNEINETKESVQDIKFGNRKAGLLVLAIAFADGVLQIHQISDQQNQLVGQAMANQHGIRSISWNKSIFGRDMIAVGGNNQESSYSKGAINSEVRTQNKFQSQQQVTNGYQNVERAHNTLSIFIRDDKAVNEQINNWIPLRHFEQTETVNDVSWANQNGRNFHLIASADCQGIKVWKFTIKDQQIDVLQQMNIDQNYQEAWRVSWNILATVFAASYKKQEIKVYKNINNIWVCEGSLTEDQERQET